MNGNSLADSYLLVLSKPWIYPEQPITCWVALALEVDLAIVTGALVLYVDHTIVFSSTQERPSAYRVLDSVFLSKEVFIGSLTRLMLGGLDWYLFNSPSISKHLESAYHIFYLAGSRLDRGIFLGLSWFDQSSPDRLLLPQLSQAGSKQSPGLERYGSS